MYREELLGLIGADEEPNLVLFEETVNVVERHRVILTIVNRGADGTFVCDAKIVDSSHRGSQRLGIPFSAKWDNSTQKETKIGHGLHDTIEIAGAAEYGPDGIWYGILELKNNRAHWFTNLNWLPHDDMAPWWDLELTFKADGLRRTAKFNYRISVDEDRRLRARKKEPS